MEKTSGTRDRPPVQSEEQAPEQRPSSARAAAIQNAANVVVRRMAQEGSPPAAAPPESRLARIEHALGEIKDKAVDEAKQLAGDTKQLAQEVAWTVEDGAAEAVGVAELAGLRYPVKAYEAQVSDGLYRGSRVDFAAMQALKAQGIRGIVNLCLENNDDAPNAAKLGLNALHIPILDNSAPTEAQMNQFIAFATSSANQPVYVHCEAGKGRTGTAVACYRIAVMHWTADQAIAEAKQFGLALHNQIAFIQKFAKDIGSGATAAGSTE
jgi:protein tyrosine phosphatase (PTP) superfamily phosphohydrolase (DUF442 family)